MSQESTQLLQRARKLSALADQVETVMDLANTCASSPAWECPNATDVRGTIAHYRRAASSAAAAMRQEAATARADARAAEREEREAARLGAGDG